MRKRTTLCTAILSGMAVCTLVAQSLPEAIKGVPVRMDTVAPPRVMPLRGTLTEFPARTNVHEIGPTTTQRLPANLKIVTLGSDGVPGPRKIQARFDKIPVRYPQPIAIDDPQVEHDALYNIKYLTEDEGLEGTVIIDILEDSRGHIWLGTHGQGVFRHDGEHIMRFGKAEGFPLLSRIRHLLEDRHGRIWFAGTEGVCYYDGHHFWHFEKTGASEELFPVAAGALLEDRKGNIWFDYGDIYCFNGSEFTIYDKKDAFTNNASKRTTDFTEGVIHKMIEDRNGHIWMATAGNGVLRFDGSQVVHLTEEDGLIDNYIGALKETSTGELWFGSGGQGHLGKGVSRLVLDAHETTFLSGTLTNYTIESGLSDNRVQEIEEDKYGTLWFATYRAGLTRFDGEQFVHFGKNEGMFDNLVGLWVGRNNVIWAGSNGSGLNQIVLSGLEHFSGNTGLFGATWIQSMTEDDEGTIWLGSAYEGLIKFDGTTFQRISQENGFPQDYIMTLEMGTNNDLWIGTRDDGCLRFDGVNFTRYSLDQGLGNTHVWDIHVDRDGIAWMSCAEGGLNRIDPSTSAISHYVRDFEKDGIGGGHIFQDKEGILWVGGLDYLARYNVEKDQLEFVAKIEGPDPDYRWVDYFLEDRLGNLWAGTAEKLIQVKDKGALLDGDFPVMEKGVHWPDVFIRKITQDATGHVWLTSNSKGLFGCTGDLGAMVRGEASWVNLTKDDGLKGNRFNQYFLHTDAHNRLWMGQPNTGMTILDLNVFEFPNSPPIGIGLIDIEIGGKHIDFQSIAADSLAGAGSPLVQVFDSLMPFVNLPVQPELPYDRNHLTFHFAAVEWSAPHSVQYSFMLEGFDDEWSPASAETKAVYRKIPPGNYTFLARARGSAKAWSEPGAYAFRILPPWWMTPWAYALYAVLVLGSVGGYIVQLRRKVRLKQEQLEREQYLNRELRELNIATTRFVPKDFVKILDKKSLTELKLGDQTDATMTVLFADIREYTVLSESMTPEQNFKFINAYVGRMGPIIQEHGGFICQYYGDGIMALFKENHHQAIRAAVAMQQALDQYNQQRLIVNRKGVKIGIGLNTGHLMLGVIGDEQRYDASVISDAVNTASRLEGLTKIFGSQIIVSEKTLREIQDWEQFTDESDYLSSFRFLGKVRVKGKDQVLRIYEVFDGESVIVQDQKLKTKPEFEKAINYYFDRDFGKAADILKEILEQAPDDIAAEYYMERSVQFIMNGVDESWSGVEEMVSK